MRESGWAFVGGGNIASPKIIPEYYAPDEDKSVSQRTKSTEPQKVRAEAQLPLAEPS
jgi:hypothetical protein